MKIVKIISACLVVIILGLAGFYGYMGGFSKITVSKQQFAANEIIFDIHKGSYDNLYESWTAFTKKYEAAGLKKCDGIGIYLDGPDTPPEKLRSIIGCSIQNLDEDKKQALKTSLPSFTLPSAESYSSSFPYRNMMSFWIGSARVYPEFQKLIAVGEINPSVAIETYGYDEDRAEVKFFMPVKKLASDYQALFDAF